MPFKIIALVIALVSTSLVVAQEKNTSKSKSEKDLKMKTQYKNIVPVRDSIFYIKNRGGNIGVSIGKDGIYMIDSQFANISQDNLETIRILSDKPIKLLVNTHHHGDHTGGNDTFKADGAVVIAHDNVVKRLRGSKNNAARAKRIEQVQQAEKKIAAKYSASEIKADPKRFEQMASEQAGSGSAYSSGPLEDIENMPTLTFKNSLNFYYNQEIKLIHVRKAHTDGDAIVKFMESNVIHTGDVFFKGKYPFVDLKSGGSIDGAIQALRQIIALSDVNTLIIPGHGDIATIKDVKYSMGMLRGLRDAVAFQVKGKKANKAQIMSMRSLTSEYDLKGFGDGFITTEKMLEILYLDCLRKNGINEDSVD